MSVSGRVSMARYDYDDSGWYQTNGNAKRNRNQGGGYDYAPPVKYYSNINFIPETTMYHPGYRLIVGLNMEENGDQSVRILETDGYANGSVIIPEHFQWISNVLPVLGDDIGVYTVRRNATIGNLFILKTIVSDFQKGNYILPDSIVRSGSILNIVLTKSGIIMATDGLLKCLDLNTGRMLWFHHYEFIQKQVQFMLYDKLLYVLTPMGLASFDYSVGGGLIDLATISLEELPSTPLVLLNNYIVVFAKKGSSSFFLAFDRFNLKKGVISSREFINKRGISVPFESCSNFMSTHSNDFYALCKNPTGGSGGSFEWSVFAYSVSLGEKIELTKQLSLSSLPIPNPKQCSMQITYSILGFAVVCDTSRIDFGVNLLSNIYQEVKIDILPETHVLSTMKNVIAMTRIDDYTAVQYSRV